MTSGINVGRILKGGLVAGAILAAFNVPAQLLLSERLRDETNAWLPGAAERMQAEGAATVIGLAMKLALGIGLVWLYATARPRLGPGPRTAIQMAVTMWLLGAIFFSDFALTEMISWTTYAMLEAMQLVAFLAAALAGAWVYREG
jgi:hypothetical protein